jgi:hypothetical protein
MPDIPSSHYLLSAWLFLIQIKSFPAIREGFQRGEAPARLR